MASVAFASAAFHVCNRSSKEALIHPANGEMPLSLAPSLIQGTEGRGEKRSGSEGRCKEERTTQLRRSGTSLMRRLAASQ